MSTQERASRVRSTQAFIKTHCDHFNGQAPCRTRRSALDVASKWVSANSRSASVLVAFRSDSASGATPLGSVNEIWPLCDAEIWPPSVTALGVLVR